MLKLERPLVVLDVETTGVDVEKDRVISLAWGKFEGGTNDAIQEYLFHPGMEIPPESTAVHGITNDDVAEAMPFFHWAKDFARQWAGCDVCGFNARSFDLPVLKREFEHAGVPWPFEGAKVVDPYRVYNRMEPRTLGAACRHYLGREIENAHEAAADVLHTVEVLMAQAERYGVTSIDDLAALERDPSWVDEGGKLRMLNGVVVVNFGKWSGTPLSQVPESYLRWVLAQDFPEDFCIKVRCELGQRRGAA